MKRTIMSICLCLSIVMGWAQVKAHYDKGSVPVVNGRVMFQETVSTHWDLETNFERVDKWAQQRFSKPNVIVSKFTNEDANNYIISLTAEEYLVFTNRFFTLDRTRINYWVEIHCTDYAATIKMTRINYWYEEERDGGVRFSAEEYITDDKAFNDKGTKMLKDEGKFRRGTIDFFNDMVMEMNTVLAQ